MSKLTLREVREVREVMCFLNLTQSPQRQLDAPRRVRGRALGGMGGKRRRRNATAQYLSPAKRGGRIVEKTRSLFFKLPHYLKEKNANS